MYTYGYRICTTDKNMFASLSLKRMHNRSKHGWWIIIPKCIRNGQISCLYDCLKLLFNSGRNNLCYIWFCLVFLFCAIQNKQYQEEDNMNLKWYRTGVPNCWATAYYRAVSCSEPGHLKQWASMHASPLTQAGGECACSICAYAHSCPLLTRNHPQKGSPSQKGWGTLA